MRRKAKDNNSPSFVKKKYYLPLISALFLSVSLIHLPLLITNFIFLIPLLFFIKDLKSGRDALKGGIWFGATLYLVSFHWIYALIEISFILAIMLYLMIIIYFSAFITILIFISYYIYMRWKIKFFLFMPFLWIVFEHLRTFGPFRFTGDHIANSMAIFPQLIQFIDVTGSYGITFWIILVSALIFEAIVSYRKKIGWKRYAAAAIIIAILPASYSLYKWQKLTYKPDLKISMIQPNIPLEKEMKRGYEKENMNVIMSLTSEAIKENPDIIIWPETSFPTLLMQWIDKEHEPSLPEVSELARSSESPILVGAKYFRMRSKQDYEIYNAALLVDSRGKVRDYYGKIYLVPFTEGLPFKEVLGIKRVGKKGLLAQLAAFSSGRRFTIFEIENRGVTSSKWEKEAHKKQEKFGVLICYEGLFPELSRQFRKEGADFLVCMTNDAWFGRTFVPYWHASTLRMRAIENRIAIARCANTGVSCFFDPAGRMYQNTEIFTKDIVTGSIIAVPPFPPIYSRFGDVIIYLSYLAVIILISFFFFHKRKH